jgi:hypothetical protein
VLADELQGGTGWLGADLFVEAFQDCRRLRRRDRLLTEPARGLKERPRILSGTQCGPNPLSRFLRAPLGGLKHAGDRPLEHPIAAADESRRTCNDRRHGARDPDLHGVIALSGAHQVLGFLRGRLAHGRRRT